MLKINTFNSRVSIKISFKLSKSARSLDVTSRHSRQQINWAQTGHADIYPKLTLTIYAAISEFIEEKLES